MQSNLENQLSVLVLGYDPYCDVWPYFDYFEKKNLKDFLGLKVFVSNDRKYQGSMNFVSLTANGDPSFSNRLRTGLKSIKTPYVLLLLEDYIICQPVNCSTLQTIVEAMNAENFSYCQVSNFIAKPRTKKSKKSELIQEIKTNQHYRISMQPAIWDIRLLNAVATNELDRPWDFEILLDHSYSTTPLYQYPRAGAFFHHAFEVTNFIDKGLYTKKAIHLIKKEHLPMPTRKVESYAMEFNKWCYNKIAAITPSFLRRSLKRTGKKMGGHFYTDN